jgi:predicted component of type VI protein secretion system
MAPSARGYLPGWLEIAEGPHKGERIRFPRLDDGTSDYTLGRGEGPAQTHIQLPVTTVSRQQARMHYAAGRWQLVNLSQTNPTSVNGRELQEPAAEHWLQDGDAVEMGDLLLRFRAR